MPMFSENRQAALRLLITDFLTERLNGKLEKLPADDPKREELIQQFVPAAWLEDAARRAAQIQVVTHTLKPVHPDAKGTNLYCPPNTLPALDVVGSHCLGDDFALDVVGNAAALDVYKFLKQNHEGRSLLDLAIAEDVDFAAALSDFNHNPVQAKIWMQAFAGLVLPRGRIASHTFAKQIYWPVEAENGESNFHLLAPLYSSPLAHWLFTRLQDDRFSEEAKAARQARKDNTLSERAVHEYPHLAVQKLGGKNGKQNISQLNSERDGKNHLLASLPPIWKTQGVRPLYKTDSLFTRFGNRKAVRKIVKALRDFLKTDPNPTVETRNQRAEYIEDLMDEFFQFSAEFWELSESQSGWTQHDDCLLDSTQCHWLDPDGVKKPVPTDTNERISIAFANWLNAQLDDYFAVGDPEFLAWRKTMNKAINAVEREENYATA